MLYGKVLHQRIEITYGIGTTTHKHGPRVGASVVETGTFTKSARAFIKASCVYPWLSY